MKKIFGICLLVMICLALVACGGNSKKETEETQSEVLPQKIDITIDNWQTYFDIVETEQIKFNNFGDVESIYVGPKLKLKDGYVRSERGADDETKLTIEYKYDTEKRYYTIEDNKVIWGEKEIHEEDKSQIIDVVRAGIYTTPEEELLSLVHSYNSGSGSGKYWYFVRVNIEVTRIKGTLYLK